MIWKPLLKLCSCFILLLMFHSNSDAETLDWADQSGISTMNLFCEPGYISAMGGVGNIEPLMFEANIIPYYTLNLKTSSRWGVLLSPQVILRMYNKESYPVRTPSYMPRVTLLKQFLNKKRQKDWFCYASWYHHSNGQDGDFYLADGTTINTKNGSFSTNWVEGGMFFSRPKKERKHLLKLGAKYSYLQEENLDGIYGRLRFNADVVTEVNLSKVLTFLQSDYFQLNKVLLTTRLNLGYIADELQGASAIDLKRFTFRYTVTYKPSFLKDVHIFTQYYRGEDYYNIYFNRTLSVLRFGITATTSLFD